MPIHPVLARELRQSKRLQKFFDSLPESSRHQIDREVREVKKEETRLRRAQHAAEYLMEAMEAELDPPPLMKTAFARNAKARQGWNSCRNPFDANTSSTSSAAVSRRLAFSTLKMLCMKAPVTSDKTRETPKRHRDVAPLRLRIFHDCRIKLKGHVEQSAWPSVFLAKSF